MNLYLIRHAISVEAGTPGFDDDSLRPLTEKGRKKMRAIAKGLRSLNVQFDLILSSPYARARETAEILADIFKIKDKVVFSDNLVPLGYADQLIAEINEKHSVDSLAIVGHEPALSALIGLLGANNSEILITLKKGGVCLLSGDDLHHDRRATLEWLLPPSILVELGEK